MTQTARKNAWRHGTVSGYSNHRCRCEQCRTVYLADLADRRARPAETVHTHGYAGYGNGCRCETCKAAKREYMRQRRAEGRGLAEERARQGAVTAAVHIKHGSQSGYYEHGCRCPDCIVRGRSWRSNRRAYLTPPPGPRP